MAYDLDNPLPVDDCERCGAEHWSKCRCDAGHPNRLPPRRADARGAQKGHR